MNKISQFCQKCGAANDPQSSNCDDCGTRLMIITFPKSLRHQNEVTPSYYEDHLLERVSVLEFRVAQLAEQLAMAYEFISGQSKKSEKDHLLMQTFFESLEEIKPELSKTFAEGFSNNHQRKKRAQQTENRTRKEFETIIAAHDEVNRDLFTHLVREGIGLLKKGEEKQAFKTLDRAILLSPRNAPLIVFVGEKLFHSGELERATTHLRIAFKLVPQNVSVLMLLGVVYADSRKAEKARKFLSALVGNSKALVCANYVWGMLAAFEKNWAEALAAFNQALVETESPELLYLKGCVYFELGDCQNSLASLEKAASIDTNFADVSFMQSLAYERLKEAKLAKFHREIAFETKEPGAVCMGFLGIAKESSMEFALPFLHFDKTERKLLTGGSLRMKNFLQRLLSEVMD